jgi:hypothetical protein
MVRYLYFRYKIRNDNYLTKCREPFISFTKTRPDAFELAKKNILERENFEKVESELKHLEKFGSVWIDEWERKRNGDNYIIKPIILGKTYYLSENFKISKNPYEEDEEWYTDEGDEDEHGEPKEPTYEKMKEFSLDDFRVTKPRASGDQEVLYVFTYIRLRPYKRYEKDIFRYYIVFYDTLDEAFEDVKRFPGITSMLKEKPLQVEYCRGINYFEIIKLDINEMVNLCERCKAIKNWKWKNY